MRKNHEAPEFQVIKQNEANAKFFVASTGYIGEQTQSGTGTTESANAISLTSINGWF